MFVFLCNTIKLVKCLQIKCFYDNTYSKGSDSLAQIFSSELDNYFPDTYVQIVPEIID